MVSRAAEIFNAPFAGATNPKQGIDWSLARNLPECERLRREFDEAVQKTFRLEERLRHAKDCQDRELVRTLAVRLAHLADERVRFNRLLIEHEAQGQPETRGGAS